MNLNDLLADEGIAKDRVLVLRHTPQEPLLGKEIGGLAAERPILFNVYQQTQSKRVEEQMKRAAYVASFIGRESGRALFVGLYEVGTNKIMTHQDYWQVQEHIELRDKFGMRGFVPEKDDRSSIVWFDLKLQDALAQWKGKLVIGWPKPDISWSRWAQDSGGKMPVLAILEESALERPMPKWDEIDWPWDQLKTLPPSWRAKLSQWKGIYYILTGLSEKDTLGRPMARQIWPDAGRNTPTLVMVKIPCFASGTIQSSGSPFYKDFHLMLIMKKSSSKRANGRYASTRALRPD